jgi:homoserine dehydrogenase
MIQIAVLGYGTVGSGVVEVIEKNKDMITKKAGEEIALKYILDLREFPGDPYEAKVVHDVNLILEDASVSIICETMGGVGAAYQFTKRALESGKSVCTSNKELVAKYGPQLLSIARAHQCNYLFEASVGGGIPIIRPLNYSLTAEKIEAITGILNGTTNYILSKMEKEGADYDTVLKKAQEMGYAERNPEADVEGYDPCRKIAILSSLMTGKNVNYEHIHTEGITDIDSIDFQYAKAAHRSIKLLAMSQTKESETGEAVYAIVAPFLIPKDHPLSMVNDVFNAVFVTGNMLGDSMYYGKGAGKLPTASAVVSDVIDCARHIGKSITCFWSEEEEKMGDIGELQRNFFVRGKKDQKEAILKAFPDSTVIELPELPEEFGCFTQLISEGDFAETYNSLGDSVIQRIRCIQ